MYRGRIDLMTYPDHDSGEIDSRLYARGVKTAKRPERKPKAAEPTEPVRSEVKKRIGIRDVIAGAIGRDNSKKESADDARKKRVEALPSEVREIYEKLPKNEIFYVDDVVKYGVTAQRFLYASTLLEINGLITVYPGARYCLK